MVFFLWCLCATLHGPNVERLTSRLAHVLVSSSATSLLIPSYNETNSLQLYLPHTIFVSCLFAFVQAIPFSPFLFILLFPLTFWSLLADIPHQLLHDCTPSLDEESSKLPTAPLQLSILYMHALCSQQVFYCVLAWPVHEFLEGKYCVHLIYIYYQCPGQLWAKCPRHLLFLGWGEKEWVGG